MKNNDIAGLGEMPAQAQEGAENAGETPGFEQGASEVQKRQPEFRVVQPEYDNRENKTVFKDVGALWRNVSSKTGREFYTLKIGKMRLLVFPNQKLAAQAGQQE